MGRPRKDGIKPRNRKTTPESWVIQFTATLITGERKRVSIVRASETECLAEYDRLKAEEVQGKLVAKSGTTVEQWMTNWLENYKRLEIERPTYISYEGSIRNHIIPVIGSIPIQKLTTGDVQKMIGKLSKKKIVKVDKDTQKVISEKLMSPTSIHKVYTTLVSGLQQAQNEGLINKNPAKAARLPKTDKVKRKVFTEDQLSAIIGIAKSELKWRSTNHCFYPALLLMIETGIRRGELLGIKWSNIDFKNNVVLIKDTIYDDSGHSKTKNKPKNPSSVRQIPISQTMMNILGSLKRISEYVFTTRKGTNVNPNNFYMVFKRWCDKAKLEGYSLHNLRHTFITNMVNDGESIPTIQSFTGHANATTLLNTYTHPISKEKLSAAQRNHERMDNILQHVPDLQHNLQHEIP